MSGYDACRCILMRCSCGASVQASFFGLYTATQAYMQDLGFRRHKTGCIRPRTISTSPLA